MRRAAFAVALLVAASDASAQLRDLINKVDPNKISRGVKAARAVTREFSEAEEKEIGRIVAARVLATHPLSSDEGLQKYVTLLGNTIASYSSRPGLDWHFAVIDTPNVNAFSAPGGYIFVTTGLLANVRSEAELASVLGHEIAHATEKHILAEIKRANVFSTGLDIAQSEFGRGDLTDALARKVSEIAHDRLFRTGIGRKEELESDRIGMKLAKAAGYREESFVDFLSTLDSLSGTRPEGIRQLTQTHPKPADRIAALRKLKPSPEGATLEERWAAWSGGN